MRMFDTMGHFNRRQMLALGGAGAVLAATGGLARAQQAVDFPVQLNWIETGDFAALFAAEQQGFDVAHGIKQSFVPGGPQVDPVQSVAGGTALVGLGGAITQCALARANGIPVKVIGAVFRSSPVGIISLAANPIKTPQDAVGKRIGLQGGARLPWSIILKEAGLSEDQMTIVPVAGDITPLVSGQIDGYWGTAVNQHITLKLQGIDNHIMTRNTIGAPEHFLTIFAMESTLAERGDDVVAWLKALMEGQQYVIDHPAEAAAYVVERSPSLQLNPEQQRQQVAGSLEFIQPAGRDLPLLEVDMEGAQIALDQISAMDMLPTPITLDDLVDTSFVERAHAA
jgi:NitT/TauT family transport system substrate-binding protein